MINRIINRLKLIKYRKKVARNVILEKKSVIDEYCYFEGHNRLAANSKVFNCSLGKGSYIGNGTVLFNTRIGRFSCVGPRVMVIRGEHPLDYVSIHPAFYSLRKQAGFSYVENQLYDEYRFIDADKNISVEIGNDVWIAADCRILEGVTIGDGAVILPGAVVNRNVDPYAIVGGVPAKLVRYRFDDEQVKKLLSIKWWNKDDEWLVKNAKYFQDIQAFLDGHVVL